MTEKQRREYARAFAAAGGKARAQKLGKKRLSEIGRKAAAKRWGKKNDRNPNHNPR